MAPGHREQAQRAGMAGYGCLMTLLLGAFCGGCLLMFLGVSSFMAAQRQAPRTMGDAQDFLGTLEGSLVLCALGALAFLVAVTSGVVLLKELGDDAARQRRGAL